MLNAYSFGGYLIYAGVKPFIDGRADMFGGEFMGLYKRILYGRDGTAGDGAPPL